MSDQKTTQIAEQIFNATMEYTKLFCQENGVDFMDHNLRPPLFFGFVQALKNIGYGDDVLVQAMEIARLKIKAIEEHEQE